MLISNLVCANLGWVEGKDVRLQLMLRKIAMLAVSTALNAQDATSLSNERRCCEPRELPEWPNRKYSTNKWLKWRIRGGSAKLMRGARLRSNKESKIDRIEWIVSATSVDIRILWWLKGKDKS